MLLQSEDVLTFNQRVTGSNPVGLTIFCRPTASLLEDFLFFAAASAAASSLYVLRYASDPLRAAVRPCGRFAAEPSAHGPLRRLRGDTLYRKAVAWTPSLPCFPIRPRGWRC